MLPESAEDAKSGQDDLEPGCEGSQDWTRFFRLQLVEACDLSQDTTLFSMGTKETESAVSCVSSRQRAVAVVTLPLRDALRRRVGSAA